MSLSCTHTHVNKEALNVYCTSSKINLCEPVKGRKQVKGNCLCNEFHLCLIPFEILWHHIRRADLILNCLNRDMLDRFDCRRPGEGRRRRRRNRKRGRRVHPSHSSSQRGERERTSCHCVRRERKEGGRTKGRLESCS